MSYAQRLAAMSRSAAPRASATPVATTEAEAPREEVVEVEAAHPPVAAPSPASITKPTPTVRATERIVTRAAEPAPARSSTIVKREATTTELVREIENHTIVEREREEAVAMPAQAKWLTDDRTAPDPLVQIAGENQDLQALLRNVRAWTSSPPTPIEQPESPVEVDTQPALVAPQPTHVSIGNVVITVEDAPATSPTRGRATATARTTHSDRLGRSHIRGG